MEIRDSVGAMKTPFGELLYEKIKISGITIPEFAIKVGIPKSTLSKISDGKLAPNWAKAIECADRLRLTGHDRQRFLDMAAVAHMPIEAQARFSRVLDLLASVETNLSKTEARISEVEAGLKRV